MQAFGFHHLEYFCHSLLVCSVSVEKSAASLIRAPLYITSCFSLASFKILSLSLNFAILGEGFLGTSIGDTWTKPNEGRIKGERWGWWGLGEWCGGGMETTVVEQQLKTEK